MAEIRPLHVRVDVDEEKLGRLENAVDRARGALKELESASMEVRDAMIGIRDAFVVSTEAGNG